VVVQRYSADGTLIGTAEFEPEDICGPADLWNEDRQHLADLAFGADGRLFVAMTHAGLVDSFDGFAPGSETTVGVVLPGGMPADLNPSATQCRQYKPRIVNGTSESDVRMALADADLVLVHQGRFEVPGETAPEADNSAAYIVLDGARQAFTQDRVATQGPLIVHEDPLSRQELHLRPDVAARGDQLAFVWQACPYRFRVVNMQVVPDVSGCRIEGLRGTIRDGQTTVDARFIASTNAQTTLAVNPTAGLSDHNVLVVAWIDTRDSPTGAVFAQRFDADGAALGSNIAVSEGPEVIYSRPEIAVRPDGAFAIAWGDSSSAGFQARVRLFGADGEPLGSPQTLGDAAQNTGSPSLAAGPTGYRAVWSEVAADGSAAVQTAAVGVAVSNAGVAETPTTRLSVWPNPARRVARLRVEVPAGAEAHVSVYDALGRLVSTPERVAESQTVLTPTLAPGVYVARLKGAFGEQVRAFVVAP
jgi:hypothetical protein